MRSVARFRGEGRLLGAAALALLDRIEVDVADVEPIKPGRSMIRGWVRASSTVELDSVASIGELTLELAGGVRLPVVVGRADLDGRAPVLGRGHLPAA